jgi:hypothetical protein
MEQKLYKGEVVINFDPETHRFSHQNGDRIRSVTTFTGILDKSTYLIPWALKLAKEFIFSHIGKKGYVIEDIVEEAMKQHTIKRDIAGDIGTEIHKWIDLWIMGKKPKIPDDEKVRNGVVAFMNFQKEYKVKWIESERIIYSRKYDYAGILDGVGFILPDKSLFLGDFKSGRIYPEHFLQTAGYQIAYEEETKKEIKERMIMAFDKNTGDFQLSRRKENEKDKKAFIALITIKNRLDELK